MATRIPGEDTLYYANLNIDRITDDWPILSIPLAHITIVAYLAFVLKIGPSFMENRPAYKLRKTLLAYNSIQVIFSLYLTIQFARYYFYRPFIPMNCTSDNKELNRVVLASYWYYSIAKVTELLDTVFFILRKKYSQVTFLHVYHHSIMMYCCCLYTIHEPTEHTLFLGFLNSIVHVFMYTYYTIAGLGPKYTKYIWWKKYITTIQLAQFCMMLTYLYFTYLRSNCPPPTSITIFTIFNIVLFLTLFLNFYIQSYSKSKKK